ncbi:hypothetical protein [Streptomyces chilikensis]|uniref:Uncharacterized protein n=1 Tax=Streptomyces chilikensis TaxID=1194079 RepID=A0ABV3EJF8_9ACTN
MALEWFLSLAGTEIANHPRLATYLETVGSPLTSVGVCSCPTFTAELVGDAPYTTPAEDDAPWYDPDLPESGEFAGLLVLNVDGLDDHPVTRTSSSAAVGGAAIGPARAQARTLTVTAVLLGSTCCGVTYGLKWLGEALAGCAGEGCGGDCLELFNCCPGEGAAADPEAFAARHRRTLRRVSLISGPTPTSRVGGSCGGSGECSGNDGEIITVEFVLSAATPWLWTDPVPVLDVPVPTDDGTDCIVWCVHNPNAPEPPPPVCLELVEQTCTPPSVPVTFTDGDPTCDVAWSDEPVVPPCQTCRLAPCPTPEDLCRDDRCTIPAPPVPPPPQTCWCRSLAVNTATYEVDLTTFPKWFGSAPMIEVRAGSQTLRRVTIKFFERTPAHEGLTCDEIVDLERCNPVATFEVAYVPRHGMLTLDGQVGRAFVECPGSSGVTPDAYGPDGGPLTFPLLRCAKYCVLLEADAIFTPADDAMVSIALSGREY